MLVRRLIAIFVLATLSGCGANKHDFVLMDGTVVEVLHSEVFGGPNIAIIAVDGSVTRTFANPGVGNAALLAAGMTAAAAVEGTSWEPLVEGDAGDTTNISNGQSQGQDQGQKQKQLQKQKQRQGQRQVQTLTNNPPPMTMPRGNPD